MTGHQPFPQTFGKRVFNDPVAPLKWVVVYVRHVSSSFVPGLGRYGWRRAWKRESDPGASIESSSDKSSSRAGLDRGPSGRVRPVLPSGASRPGSFVLKRGLPPRSGPL